MINWILIRVITDLLESLGAANSQVVEEKPGYFQLSIYYNWRVLHILLYDSEAVHR